MGLFVSPAAIKFTVMWLLMSVFFLSMEKIESTDATEGIGEEFPVNGTPVVETPSVVTGTPFDFAPLWKLIPLSTPPSHSSPASIYHSRVTIGPALLPRMGLYSEASQPDVCSSRGFFSLFLILFELSPKGECRSKQNALPLSLAGDQKSGGSWQKHWATLVVPLVRSIKEWSCCEDT